MWSTPPAAIDSLRTMLLASSSATSAGLTSGHFHYPSADFVGENSGATPDSLPGAVLFQETMRREVYAAGAAGLAGGTLRVEIYMSGSPGTVETAGQAILADLLANDTGLAIRDGECSVASDPMPGQRAANSTGIVTSYRCIVLTLNYGLSAG